MKLIQPRFMHDVGPAIWARVYASAVQAVADTTATYIDCNTEFEDPFGFHDNSTNPSRLQVPLGYAGVYLAGFHGFYAPNAAAVGRRIGGIRLNRATDIVSEDGSTSATLDTFVSGSTAYRLAEGDYLEVVAFQTSGLSLNFRLDATRAFWLYRIGD